VAMVTDVRSYEDTKSRAKYLREYWTFVSVTRNRCYDFKNIFAEKITFFAQTTAYFGKNLIITFF
jgi:hypothetical protein